MGKTRSLPAFFVHSCLILVRLWQHDFGMKHPSKNTITHANDRAPTCKCDCMHRETNSLISLAGGHGARNTICMLPDGGDGLTILRWPEEVT
jgi:hypothetical protein